MHLTPSSKPISNLVADDLTALYAPSANNRLPIRKQKKNRRKKEEKAPKCARAYIPSIYIYKKGRESVLFGNVESSNYLRATASILSRERERERASIDRPTDRVEGSEFYGETLPRTPAARMSVINRRHRLRASAKMCACISLYSFFFGGGGRRGAHFGKVNKGLIKSRWRRGRPRMLKKFLIPCRPRFIARTGWPAGFDGAEFSRSACALIKYSAVRRKRKTRLLLVCACANDRSATSMLNTKFFFFSISRSITCFLSPSLAAHDVFVIKRFALQKYLLRAVTTEYQ